MSQFEYKAVPAPVKGVKARGVKTVPDRFALAMTNIMNDMAADGWEYQRADSLPCEERQGLTGKTTTYQNILIFRRALPDASTILADLDPSVSQPAAPVEAPVSKTPEAIAAAAAASLTALAPEGDAPSVSADQDVEDESSKAATDPA